MDELTRDNKGYKESDLERFSTSDLELLQSTLRADCVETQRIERRRKDVQMVGLMCVRLLENTEFKGTAVEKGTKKLFEEALKLPSMQLPKSNDG